MTTNVRAHATWKRSTMSCTVIRHTFVTVMFLKTVLLISLKLLVSRMATRLADPDVTATLKAMASQMRMKVWAMRTAVPARRSSPSRTEPRTRTCRPLRAWTLSTTPVHDADSASRQSLWRLSRILSKMSSMVMNPYSLMTSCTCPWM